MKTEDEMVNFHFLMNLPGSHIDVVDIGPKEAKELLALNKGNRKISEYQVERLTKAMRDSQWIYNGDPIRISSDGNLIDGQHRLIAIQRSGLTFPFVVSTGLSPSASKTIDVDGKARSSSDIMTMLDPTLKRSHDRSAIARVVMAVKSGSIFTTNRIVSNVEVVEWLLSHQLPESCLKAYSAATSSRIMLGSIAGGLSYIFSHIHPGLDEELTMSYGNKGAVSIFADLREKVRKCGFGSSHEKKTKIVTWTITAWNIAMGSNDRTTLGGCWRPGDGPIEISGVSEFPDLQDARNIGVRANGIRPIV